MDDHKLITSIITDGGYEYVYPSDFINKNPVDFKKRMDESSDFFTKNMDLLLPMFEYIRTKLEFALTIRKYEKKIDKDLGKEFASFYFMKDNQKCFSDLTLSYYFFNMIKTNIISDEATFFLSFLNELSKQSQKSAINFMVANYSYFADPTFLTNLSLKLKKMPKKELNKKLPVILREFSFNYSLTISSYKQAAGYSMDPSMTKMNIFECLFLKFKLLVSRQIAYLKTADGEEDFEELIQNVIMKATDIMVAGCMFMIVIPFLNKIISYILAKLIYKMIKYLMEKFGIDFKSIYNKFQKIKNTKKVKSIKNFVTDLDYKEIMKIHLNEKFEGDDEDLQFINTAEIPKLGDLFYEGANDVANVYNQTEIFHVKFIPPELKSKIFQLAVKIQDSTKSERLSIDQNFSLENDTPIKQESSKEWEATKDLMKKTLILL